MEKCSDKMETKNSRSRKKAPLTNMLHRVPFPGRAAGLGNPVRRFAAIPGLCPKLWAWEHLFMERSGHWRGRLREGGAGAQEKKEISLPREPEYRRCSSRNALHRSERMEGREFGRTFLRCGRFLLLFFANQAEKGGVHIRYGIGGRSDGKTCRRKNHKGEI